MKPAGTLAPLQLVGGGGGSGAGIGFSVSIAIFYFSFPLVELTTIIRRLSKNSITAARDTRIVLRLEPGPRKSTAHFISPASIRWMMCGRVTRRTRARMWTGKLSPAGRYSVTCTASESLSQLAQIFNDFYNVVSVIGERELFC